LTPFFHVEDDKNKPLDERIDGIVSNINHLFSDLGKLEQSASATKLNLEKHMLDTGEKVSQLKEAVDSELVAIHTSDITIALAGLFLLLIGIGLSTYSQELFHLRYSLWP